MPGWCYAFLVKPRPKGPDAQRNAVIVTLGYVLGNLKIEKVCGLLPNPVSLLILATPSSTHPSVNDELLL
jgi:hypothetical protein